MTLTKKHYTIIAVIIGLIAVWYFFLRKKPTESGYTKRFASVTPSVTPEETRACNASTTNACGTNMVCVNGRCEFASGSHW
jgi:hypothetical protein